MRECCVVFSAGGDEHHRTAGETSSIDLNSHGQVHTFVNNWPAENGCGFSRQRMSLYCAQANKKAIHRYYLGKEEPQTIWVGEEPSCLSLSPDGHYLAVGTKSGKINLWHLTKGHLVRIWPAHLSTVTKVEFSQDSSTLVSGSLDSVVRVWSMLDISDLSQQRPAEPSAMTAVRQHASGVVDLLLCSRPDWIVTAGQDYTVKLCSTREDRCLLSVTLDCEPCCLACPPLAHYALVGGSKGRIYHVPLYADSHAVLGGTGEGEGSAGAAPFTVVTSGGDEGADITAIMMSADNRQFVTGSSSGEVALWDSHTRQKVARLRKLKGPVRSLQLAVIPEVIPQQKSLADFWPSSGLEKNAMVTSQARSLQVRVDKALLLRAEAEAKLRTSTLAEGATPAGTYEAEPEEEGEAGGAAPAAGSAGEGSSEEVERLKKQVADLLRQNNDLLMGAFGGEGEDEGEEEGEAPEAPEPAKRKGKKGAAPGEGPARKRAKRN